MLTANPLHVSRIKVHNSSFAKAQGRGKQGHSYLDKSDAQFIRDERRILHEQNILRMQGGVRMYNRNKVVPMAQGCMTVYNAQDQMIQRTLFHSYQDRMDKMTNLINEVRKLGLKGYYIHLQFNSI